MEHFAGLDVSVKETSVCIVDDTGKIVREVKVASKPEALLAVLKNPAYHFKRIGFPGLKSRSAAVSALLTVPPYFAAFPPGITNSTTTLRSRG